MPSTSGILPLDSQMAFWSSAHARKLGDVANVTHIDAHALAKDQELLIGEGQSRLSVSGRGAVSLPTKSPMLILPSSTVMMPKDPAMPPVERGSALFAAITR